MRAKLIDLCKITDETHHNAFTDICYWKNSYYCAYRVAQTHDISPPGHIVIQGGDTVRSMRPQSVICHAIGDARDPKFILDDDILWMMCGVYLPFPGRDVLSGDPSENIISTHIAYTTDGVTWSQLRPILRPGYWGWSSVKMGSLRCVASYHTGAIGDASSIDLWVGRSPLSLGHQGQIYHGASSDMAALSPSEPVIWHDKNVDIMRCAVRTEGTMEMGAARGSITRPDAWRWWSSGKLMHPSAALETPHGWILAGRWLTITPGKKYAPGTHYRYAALVALDGASERVLIMLPSDGDCAYCGLCEGPDGTILVSYYSQHQTPRGIPGAAVYVATVRVTP